MGHTGEVTVEMLAEQADQFLGRQDIIVLKEELACTCADRSWYGEEHDTQCNVKTRGGIAVIEVTDEEVNWAGINAVKHWAQQGLVFIAHYDGSDEWEPGFYVSSGDGCLHDITSDDGAFHYDIVIAADGRVTQDTEARAKFEAWQEAREKLGYGPAVAWPLGKGEKAKWLTEA